MKGEHRIGRGRTKDTRRLVAAVERAGGTVAATTKGHLKVTGPNGSAVVAGDCGRPGTLAVTLASIRSRTGLTVVL